MPNHKTALKRNGTKQHTKEPEVSLLVARITKAGVAGAIALKDKKTRAKVTEVIQMVTDKASEYVYSMKKEGANQLEQKANETADEVRKIVQNSHLNKELIKRGTS